MRINYKLYPNTKKFTKTLLCVSFIFSVVLTGCYNSDDVQGNLYTFTDKMVGGYLADSATVYSEFTTLLDTTKVLGLLNTYGAYTCFAPTNEAMRQFYQSRGKKSLADFPMDTLKMIAHDHIINGVAVGYVDFVNGRLPELSMNERYISISFADDGSTYVNKTSKILLKDIVVHNGVIHKLNEVLQPTNSGIVEAISEDSTFSIFYDALLATGLSDSLYKVKDDSYNFNLYKDFYSEDSWSTYEPPLTRKYGYTVLLESNHTMTVNGISDFQSLKAYAASVYDQVYPEDASITNIRDRRNSLNRFIAYHLITKQLSYNKFIDLYDTNHMLKNQDMYEYIETMCPNTLLEVRKSRSKVLTNLFNYIPETNHTVQIVKGHYDYDAMNGVFHEIDGMLVYDKTVEQMLTGKRLRFDSSSFFDELTNNDMRGCRYNQNTVPLLYTDKSRGFNLPRFYINRISTSEQTVVGYLAGYYKFQDYEGDEIFLNAKSGKLFNFTITTPPIPAGTYEVRFGYLTNGKRGITQFYFDGDPCGVPVNLNTSATDAAIGYVTPGTVTADPNGYENDKTMRNRGYMKGPACYKVITTGWSFGENARYSPQILRKILGTYTFNSAGHHTLTAKGLSNGEFMFDYMEFVPTSVLESEDIY